MENKSDTIPNQDIRTYIHFINTHTPYGALLQAGYINPKSSPSFFHIEYPYTTQGINTLLYKILINPQYNWFLRIGPISERPPNQKRLSEQFTLGTSVLWAEVDDDSEQTLNAILNYNPQPSLVVHSGRGYHAYWLLNQLEGSIDAIKRKNKYIYESLKVYNADSAYDVARVLRIPGTFNHKLNPPISARIIHNNTKSYDFNIFPESSIDSFEQSHFHAHPLPPNFLEEIKSKDLNLYQRISTEQEARFAGASVRDSNSHKIDRSRNDQFIAIRLLSLGYDPEIVISVLNNPLWFSGSRTKEKGYTYSVDTVNKAIAYIHNNLHNENLKKNNNFNITGIAHKILETYKFITVKGSIFVYDKGAYRNDGEAFLRKLIIDILNNDWRSRISNEIVTYIKELTDTDPDLLNNYANLLNVQNGMLNLNTLELHPHHYTYLSTIQLPVIWNPNADTTIVEKFISDILPNDTIDLFWQYVGSCFYMQSYQPKMFLIFIGPKDSGKSKLMEFIRLLFGGDSNVSTIDLRALCDNNFAVEQLFNKIANIGQDITDQEAKDVSMIKKLTGDDTISAEIKYVRQRLQFRNIARLFFTANDTPTIKNMDEAYFGRAHVIKCNNVFTSDIRDPFILDKLNTTENLSAALNLAISGYRKLMENEFKLEIPLSVKSESWEYRLYTDSVAYWIESTSEVNINYKIKKSDAYLYYKVWCDDKGINPISEKKFQRSMKQLMSTYKFTDARPSYENQGQVASYIGRKFVL